MMDNLCTLDHKNNRQVRNQVGGPGAVSLIKSAPEFVRIDAYGLEGYFYIGSLLYVHGNKLSELSALQDGLLG